MKLPISLSADRSAAVVLPGSQQPGKKLEASPFSMSLAQSKSMLQSSATALPDQKGKIPSESLLQPILQALDKEDLPNWKDELVVPDVQALLAKLPAELVQHIQTLFQNGTTSAGILKGESLPAAKAIAQLIHEFRKDKLNVNLGEPIEMEKSVIPEVKKSIEQLFSVLPNRNQPKSARAILNGLVQQLEKLEQSVGGKSVKTLEPQAFLDKMERAAQRKNVSGLPVQWNSAVNKQTDRSVSSVVQAPVLMPALEQFVLHVPRSGSSEDVNKQFVKELQNMILSGKFEASSNGMSKLNIRLTPEHLGTLNIELVSKNGELSARILTNSAYAKEIMESQMHLLKNALHGNSIQLDRIIVLEQPQEQKFQQQGSNHHPHDQQPQNHQQTQDDDQQDELFSHLLDDGKSEV
ncbi:flagellar hook-length control protein FliK [Fictibacillus terranigra]|uniref:Flagellar hook-length control protein FliK n=1 Tax=Fictibacillus terranigra TaxID=3058424 RepID=A0ABT8E6B1_9BACL|nr:flagellar hook-length control protein FliK [Fictibacillus sp. CENA-BCM004]MDN4073435.1 flagellar hook-length control protein FliK [Fictibacillus sp. CENA-BCM004]